MNPRTEYESVRAFVTADGSTVRELMQPPSHGNRAQSLAEARVGPLKSTTRHRHVVAEELYHVTMGNGTLEVGDEIVQVRPGITVAIMPGVPHKLTNTSDTSDLVVLCCCSPPYTHQDTVLLE